MEKCQALLMKKIKDFLISLCTSAWKVGKEDPRRITHAIKVGVALTVVSFLYVLEPLFKGVGKNAMWAVMTVVVTSLEFSEALPYAAFASLLVEMVARLELVIEEVEELGRAADFKEFSAQDEIAIDVKFDTKKRNMSAGNLQDHI